MQINKKSIIWKDWINKKIIYIGDLIDEEGHFITLNDITQKGINCNFLKWLQLKSAISTKWKQQIEANSGEKIIINYTDSIDIQKQKTGIP